MALTVCSNYVAVSTISATGDYVVFTDATGDTVGQYECLNGQAIPVDSVYSFMSESDFNQLWPLIAGLLVTGYIVKRLLATLV